MKMKYIAAAACLVMTSVSHAKTDDLGHELKAVPSTIETYFNVYSPAPTLEIKYTDSKANEQKTGVVNLATVTVNYLTGGSVVSSLCYKPDETVSKKTGTDTGLAYSLSPSVGSFADGAADGKCLSKQASDDSIVLTLSGDATVYKPGNYVLTGILYSYYK